jgi:hypothetical protein
VSARAMWVENHRLRPGQVPSVADPLEDELELILSVESSAPQALPPNSALPPTRTGSPAASGSAAAWFQCPVCDYSHRYSSDVAEHIEKEHPELGQQSFRLECPQDGCNWATWWNKVGNNKAKTDAELLEHLEVQHNTNSPRYDPWFTCECGIDLPRSEMEKHNCKRHFSRNQP